MQAGFVNLAHNMPLGPYPLIYQILSEYFLSMWELWHAQAVPPKRSFRGNDYEGKKARFVYLNQTSDKTTHPDLHPNQILPKNCKDHRSWAHKNVFTERQVDARLITISSEPFIWKEDKKKEQKHDLKQPIVMRQMFFFRDLLFIITYIQTVCKNLGVDSQTSKESYLAKDL